MPSNEQHTPALAAAWAKRLGMAGFLFFFVKGLLWLAIGAAVWFFAS